jgi:uncharacterized membrane protein
MRTTISPLVLAHLITIIPAFVLGTWLMLSRKGSPIHKLLGKVYLVLMFATAIITLCMSAQLGPQLFGHFGFIHLFSLSTLWFVPVAYFSAKQGNIRRHKKSMIGLYIGGLLIAGAFAFAPGRLLHQWLHN